MAHDFNEIYKKLVSIRKSKDLKLAANPYLRPEYQLRYYQTQGVAHMYMLKRMVLGDDCGLGKCNVASTKVITPRGVIRLDDKSLWNDSYDFNNRLEDTFYNTPRGTKLASDGIRHAPKIYFGGVKPTIKFKTKLGTHAQATYRHRWKVMLSSGNIAWVETRDLKIGDRIAVGRGQDVWGYKKLDKDEAWLLGFTVGDGSFNTYYYENRKEVSTLCITNTDDYLIKKCISLSEKYFYNPKDKKRKIRKEGYKEVTNIWESGSENVLKLFERYGLSKGCTAEFKTIPDIIKGSNKTTFCSFLQGLFDSDGYISEDGTIELCLASKEIIEDIQLYLLNMGIVSRVSEKYNKKYKKHYYNLRILEVEGKKKFYSWINFSCPHKKERLKKVVNLKRISNQTRDIIPFQQERLQKISDIVPKKDNIRWLFKDILKARNSDSGEFSYDCARKLISLEKYMPFLKDSPDFQELKEIINFGYYYTEITEIDDGGEEEVFDLSVPDGNTYLANGMVSHNTLTTLATYTSIYSKRKEQKLMIICPSSAMYQWQSEVKKFCTDDITCQIVKSADIKVVDGVRLKSKDYLKSFDAREYLFKQFEKNDNNVLIFNYNTLVTDSHVILALMKKYKFLIVFDEATAFKNSKSHTFTYASEISKAGDRVVGLSATIIKNNLLEAFSIYKVIMPGLFISLDHFKKSYCLMEKVQLWKGKGKRGRVVNKIIGYKNLKFFKDAIDPYFLGRKKSEVASELPKIISREVIVDMLPKQRDIYDDALAGFLDYDKYNFNKIKTLFDTEEDFSGEIESKEMKQIDKLTALIYCQQICNCPEIIGFANAPSAKEEELLRILDEELQGEKVVIYTRFKTMVNRLEKLITEKLKVKVTKITGDVDAEQREANKLEFNTSEDTNVMLINSAAKEAVNLQSSGYLFFYDLPFSYGDFLQIIGRIHRIGSRHENIFLMYMICRDSVDEKTHGILSSKKELFDAILGDSAVGAIHIDKSVVNTLFEQMISEAQSNNKV